MVDRAAVGTIPMLRVPAGIAPVSLCVIETLIQPILTAGDRTISRLIDAIAAVTQTESVSHPTSFPRCTAVTEWNSCSGSGFSRTSGAKTGQVCSAVQCPRPIVSTGEGTIRIESIQTPPLISDGSLLVEVRTIGSSGLNRIPVSLSETEVLPIDVPTTEVLPIDVPTTEVAGSAVSAKVAAAQVASAAISAKVAGGAVGSTEVSAPKIAPTKVPAAAISSAEIATPEIPAAEVTTSIVAGGPTSTEVAAATKAPTAAAVHSAGRAAAAATGASTAAGPHGVSVHDKGETSHQTAT